MPLLTSIKRRWDSSDPERAPPPLPFPPGAGSPATKHNTSSGIAAAAKKFVDQARESNSCSVHTPQGSPERSLVKSQHQRLQGFPTGSVKDLRSYLDGGRSPERPASRGGLSNFSRQQSFDDISSPLSQRSSTPTPAGRDPMKDTPVLRPSTRPPPKAILGDGTPPSATMLALQTMHVPEHHASEAPSTPTPSRAIPSADFSSQLRDLLSITTSLQKEMAGLNRRSKDNAIDLISLKEATNQRDEDIRKSLRELANSVAKHSLLSPPPAHGMLRWETGSGVGSVDGKSFTSPPSVSKGWSVPRAASAHSFRGDERFSPYSVEGAASVAMLEKIIREMVTKEGQERLLSTLSEIMERSQKDNTEAAKKVEELSEFIKEMSESRALVMHHDRGPKLELNYDADGNLAKVGRQGEDDEVLKLLHRLKESIAHAGGSTNEVKSLVRDLRGEVLGMGREIGRKLDQISGTQLDNSLDKGIETGHSHEHASEVQRIVEEGMAELKQHINSLLRERVERDDDAFKQITTVQSNSEGEEMLAMVRHALAEHQQSTSREVGHSFDREGMIEAVKDGLKDFEPNIELQQYGLERDEVLAVLREGLEDYQASKAESQAVANIDKGEIFEVMQEALKDFQPPFPTVALDHMKEEIIESVRQAIPEHPPAPSAMPIDMDAINAQVLEAVREGLAKHGPAPRELEISREDLFAAVNASLDGSSIPFGGLGQQVLHQMQELIDNIRAEFAQYSAANGRDTEQVLDAVKDGLESLRTEVESYVDRAQDVTGKDEIVDTVKSGLEQLRVDVQGYVAEGPAHDNGKQEMLDYIKSEFEHLHEAMNNRDLSREIEGEAPKADHTAEIVFAIKDGIQHLKQQIDEKNRDFEIDFPTDEINDALREELVQLQTSILRANAADKDEIIETIQETMGSLHSKLNNSDASTLSGGAMDGMLEEMHHEFATLKETLQVMLDEKDLGGDHDAINRAVDELKEQLMARQSEVSSETLAAVRDELEKFKEAMNSSVVLGSAVPADYGPALEGIRGAIDELRETSRSVPEGGSDELLEAMRAEFETLRHSISTTMVPGGSNDEALDAVRLGLDDLKTKLDAPHRNQEQQTEMLNTINEGLENLRAEVVKTLDKPQDLTVNYEILDTLKEGLVGLRADVEVLKANHESRSTVVLAEKEQSRDMLDEDSPAHLKPADLEKMEVLLAQLQIKVEAMDSTVQDIPHPQVDRMAAKEDLHGLEAMIKDVQETVLALAARETASAVPEGIATKQDTDAIETLLRNTKAQLEEMTPPDMENAVTKDHLDALEAVVRVTNEAVDGIVEKLENTTAAKADVAVVEVLAQDVKALLEELKEGMAPSEAKTEPLTKDDLDVLGVLCTEIKAKLSEMDLPEAQEMPTKADVEQLQGLITDFRESHDKLRDSYENDIAITAKAFDDRKQEFQDTIDHIGGVKEALNEVKEELLARLGESDTGINALGTTLKEMEERTAGHEPVVAEVKEVMEALNREFERAHSSIEALKVDHLQSAETSLEKQAEHKDAAVAELTEKLEALFDGLMTKYDDAQRAAEEKAKAAESDAVKQAEVLENTRTMADELKLSIDTLGSTLTGLAETFPEKVDQMTEESRTVFQRVDETHAKVEEVHDSLKGEHSATRETISQVLTSLTAVQNDLIDHHPRFLVSLEELKALVNQQYEHSQTAKTSAAEQHQAVRDLSDHLKQSLQETKDLHNSHLDSVRNALPAPIEPYNDTELHTKLDTLLTQTPQISLLDAIHEKVLATAAEVSAFVSQQAAQITQTQDQAAKEAEALALELERRSAQKSSLEEETSTLQSERSALQEAIASLRAERESLAADVASLETAMRIRREELHTMDAKAEAIEKRVRDGILNQSKLLLLAKKPTKKTKREAGGRDLRVPSASSMNTTTTPSMKTAKRAPAAQERRIMSLGEISGNSRAAPPPSTQAGFSVKRSHSVRSAWKAAGAPQGKENALLLKDVEEDEDDEDDVRSERTATYRSRGGSITEEGSVRPESRGTSRRSSYASTYDDASTFPEVHRDRGYDEEGSEMGEGSFFSGKDEEDGVDPLRGKKDFDSGLGTEVNGTVL
ncbi:hypothetical protein K470DRAFT_301287 [Piedraia hortae CBS 480.64]|uniref:Chromosome segregation ATPase family protein n=1 Tax=Piedraia hortae CBS 480.64 TaxID=1314780 RepID=A0A6A7BQT1_9PEZI|nr:hypothetical protein K470DRAFT_301287 [Piedraia hortae CBS 480.64]